MGKVVLFIIASMNFRDEELFDTKKVVEEHGIKTVVASSTLKEVTGVLGGKIKPDILFDQVKDYDAIVFVGGGGAKEYWNNKTAHKMATEAYSNGKVVAAICIAPTTLANAGLLSGKKFTSWPSEVNTIQAKKGIFVDKPVVTNGKIVTANGPKAASEFGKTISELLK